MLSTELAATAARGTARLSAMIFAVYLAAPGLARWWPARFDARRRRAWLGAFLAAHTVHFGAVLALARWSPTRMFMRTPAIGRPSTRSRG
jgi:hypothetical protein